MPTAWIVQRGGEGPREFVRPNDGLVAWTADRCGAERFLTKVDALTIAEQLLIEERVTVAVYPLEEADLRVGPGPFRPIVHAPAFA